MRLKRPARALARQLPLLVAAAATGLPAGDYDGDPSDWSGAPWIVLALLALAFVVGGVLLARRRTHRHDD
jgi:predicted MFS family arabinose efflux permease